MGHLRIAVAGWLVLASPVRAQTLPPEVQADRDLVRAERLIAEGRHEAALAVMDEIADLQRAHGLTLPEAFHFQRAEAARDAGQREAAMDLLRGYLQAYGRDGEFYREALVQLDELESQQLLYINWRFVTEGETPAERARRQEVLLAGIEERLASGADPNAQYGYGQTPLHRAARYDENLAVVEVLLVSGADPNARDDNGETPLHVAAQNNDNPAVIEALLAAGADPNVRGGLLDSTPLHLVVVSGNYAMVEALLAAGADPNVGDEVDFTPLHLAAENSRDHDALASRSMVEVLLAAGADPNARQIRAMTPLYLAVSSYGGYAMVEALLAAGADPNVRDDRNRTPLDIATAEQNSVVIDMLRLAGGRDGPR